MRQSIRLTAIGIVISLNLAGCPVQSSLSDLTGDQIAGGTTSNTNAASNQTGGTSIDDSSSNSSTTRVSPSSAVTSDELTDRFPGCQSPNEEAAWRAQVLMLVNRERSSRGLATLIENATLQGQAEEYACELIHYDYFAHENPVTGSTLGDRSLEFGYDYMVVGENLAAGQTTPERAVADWMNSPGHRANILDERFTEIGIAVRIGGDYGIYWVQEFGRPFKR
ncbi:MAG: CAP domain-containing protein [Phycisphaerales bacterium]|nr:CAP domain-containing protein [Phycisphaerales bacterium]